MSAAWRPLPIWCAQDDDLDLARIREVKESLWLDYLVKPSTAEPSIEGRVLAWNTAPPFVCSYALVDPLGTDDELAEALQWVLYEREDCGAAMEVADMLAVLLGPGTQEIPPEQLAAEERYAAYEEGRD